MGKVEHGLFGLATNRVYYFIGGSLALRRMKALGGRCLELLYYDAAHAQTPDTALEKAWYMETLQSICTHELDHFDGQSHSAQTNGNWTPNRFRCDDLA